MHPPIKSIVLTGLLSLLTTSVHAAVTVYTDPFDGFPQFSYSNTISLGISLGDAGSLRGKIENGNFVFFEEDEYFIGVGPTVPVDTVLTGANYGTGANSFFSDSNPTGQYYLPFSKENFEDSFFIDAIGYVTFNYDNSTQTITFVSSTVQDQRFGSLVVVPTLVPEPSGIALLGIGALGFAARRKRMA